MATRKLDRLGLDAQLVSRLLKAKIVTVRDLLEANPLTLMAAGDLSPQAAQWLASAVSAKVLRGDAATALDLHARSLLADGSASMRTGIAHLDDRMGGGLPTGTLTELVGPPGIGKTQFLMCCIVQTVSGALECAAQKGGAGASPPPPRTLVALFDTELKFSAERLWGIATSKHPELYKPGAPYDYGYFMSCIAIKRPESCEQLLGDTEQLQALVIQEGTRLIVIDSIAALARKEGLGESEKATFIFRQSAVLKKLADLCRLCVIATNQVTQDFSGDGPLAVKDSVADVDETFRPTLGLTWHQCLHTRLAFSRITPVLAADDGSSDELAPHEQGSGETEEASQPRGFDRQILVAKSPYLPPVKFVFKIRASGIVTADFQV